MVTEADVFSFNPRWAVAEWWKAWNAETPLESYRRWRDGLDDTRPDVQDAIREQIGKSYWERIVQFNFREDCEVKDGLEAWEEMKRLVVASGWKLYDVVEVFPSDVRAFRLRMLMGKNACCWGKARRLKTRAERIVQAVGTEALAG